MPIGSQELTRRKRSAKIALETLFDRDSIETLLNEINRLENEILAIKGGVERALGSLQREMEKKWHIRGHTGEQGIEGEKGDIGKHGRSGIDGKNGKDGKEGKLGKTGKNGLDGLSGLDGKDGIDGRNGNDFELTADELIETINDGEEKIDIERIEGLEKGIDKRIDRNRRLFSVGAVYQTDHTLRYRTTAVDYTITADDYMVECTDKVTITLTKASEVVGKHFNIKRTGTREVTVKTRSPETIDGEDEQVINVRFTSLVVMSNGTNWLIV